MNVHSHPPTPNQRAIGIKSRVNEPTLFLRQESRFQQDARSSLIRLIWALEPPLAPYTVHGGICSLSAAVKKNKRKKETHDDGEEGEARSSRVSYRFLHRIILVAPSFLPSFREGGKEGMEGGRTGLVSRTNRHPWAQHDLLLLLCQVPYLRPSSFHRLQETLVGSILLSCQVADVRTSRPTTNCK